MESKNMIIATARVFLIYGNGGEQTEDSYYFCLDGFVDKIDG